MSNQIFPKGAQVSANFTGKAFVNMLVPDTEGVYDCQVYDVLFEAACRNNWHTHPGGQLLLCTDGEGYYQEKGKVAQRLKKGDIVQIPPNVEHWHGAAPDSDFIHIGISPNTDKGAVVWLKSVSDEEYDAATKGEK
jgi:quercetin dioxygenase-like cupin family protein